MFITVFAKCLKYLLEYQLAFLPNTEQKKRHALLRELDEVIAIERGKASTFYENKPDPYDAGRRR
jgi:hypothetical protein